MNDLHTTQSGQFFAQSPFGATADRRYMKEALLSAKQAARAGEVPIGAVVVDAQGAIVARAHNQTIACKSQTGHAELRALAQAGALHGDWRLDGYWVYVTLAPCAMCMHALYLSRVAGIVYGAHSPKYGFQLDRAEHYAVYKKDVVRIISGVCSNEAAQLLHDFFAQKRKERICNGT